MKLEEIIKRNIKRALNEHYNGELYHWTLFGNLLDIILTNRLDGYTCDGYNFDHYERKIQQPRYGMDKPHICFTRDKGYNVRKGDGAAVRLTFDTDDLSQIRGGRLYPVNFTAQFPDFDEYDRGQSKAECEERFYCDELYPFDRYVKSIDIYITKEDYDYGGGVEGWTDEYCDRLYEENPEMGDIELSHELWRYLIDWVRQHEKLRDKLIIHTEPQVEL